MDHDYFNKLRERYRTKNIGQLTDDIKYLIQKLANTDFLDDKLLIHPLGFVYAKVHEYEDKELIRLHIRNILPNIKPALMDIHNHYYDVNSFVIKGEIINTLYELFPGRAATHSLYIGSYGDNNLRILRKDQSRACIGIFNTQFIVKGSLYHIDKNEIHCGTVKDNTITITLVYSANPGNPSPLVFGPLDGEEVYQFPATRLADETVIESVKYHLLKS